MKNYLWLLNPRGREVEIEAEKVEELLSRGYRLVADPTVQIPKLPLDASLQVGHYPYGGYGRVDELLRKRIQFDANSTNKIYLGYPQEERPAGDRVFLITAWEADKLPIGWVKKLNNYDVVIVPSKWCKDLFLSSGVTVPVELMVQGTDDFTLVEDVPMDTFTFLHYNAFSDHKRKGWDLVVQAFVNVFGRYEKTRLILKGRLHDNEEDLKLVPRRANIEILTENMNRMGMKKLQELTHCFVFPSRGEGIGLPPIETMARGIPTIVTDAYGMTEHSYFGVKITSFDYVPAVYPGTKYEGTPAQWVEPNLHQLEDKMFYVYRNYERAKAEAIDKASIIKRYFNLDIQAETFVDIIEKHL